MFQNPYITLSMSLNPQCSGEKLKGVVQCSVLKQTDRLRRHAACCKNSSDSTKAWFHINSIDNTGRNEYFVLFIDSYKFPTNSQLQVKNHIFLNTFYFPAKKQTHAEEVERIGCLQNELLARMYDDVYCRRNIFSQNI